MVSSMMDFATSMRPDFARALIDTIHYYGWSSIIVFYCEQEGNPKIWTVLSNGTSLSPVIYLAGFILIADTVSQSKPKGIPSIYLSFLPGLHRLQSLFEELSLRNASIRIEVVRQISSAEEVLAILYAIEMTNR
jgi:hypothetical protein